MVLNSQKGEEKAHCLLFVENISAWSCRETFCDMYPYWKLLPSFPISCLPREALHRAPTGANEPQLPHPKGCHLEFKHHIKYFIITQLWKFNYLSRFILMKRVLCKQKCYFPHVKHLMDSLLFVMFWLFTLIHLCARLHIWTVCFGFEYFIFAGLWHEKKGNKWVIGTLLSCL